MPVLIGAAALVVAAAVVITVLALQGSPQPAVSSGTAHRPAAGSPPPGGSSPSSTGQATPTVVPAPAAGLKPLATLVAEAHGTDCKNLPHPATVTDYIGCRYTTLTGAFYFGVQFAKADGLSRALPKLNASYKFRPATASAACPPAKGAAGGQIHWAQHAPFNRPHQVLECFLWRKGLLKAPTIIWTIPSERAAFVASIKGLSNDTLSELVAWWRKIHWH